MNSISDIKNTLSNHRDRLFREYSIKSLAIFGSYSRGENTDKSDLDVLVEFNGKIGIRFVDLADEIESIVGLKVDLVSRNGIKKGYLSAIDTDLVYV